MNAKKTMRTAAIIGRRGVSKDDKKPFRKAITAVPHEMAEGLLISDASETPSETKAELANVSAITEKMPPALLLAKTAPAPVLVLPWADASAKVTAPFLLRLPEATHLKLLWLKDNLPNTSLQKLILAAVEKDVAALIKKNFCA